MFNTTVSIISEHQVIEDMTYNLKNTEIDSNENTIFIDDINIVIEFTNGKSVSMQTSECGSIDHIIRMLNILGSRLGGLSGRPLICFT